MLKWLAVGLTLLFPCVVQAQKTAKADDEATRADKMVCADKYKDEVAALLAAAKKPPKSKKSALDGNVIPLSLVICEVENALNTYQQGEDVAKKILPDIATADFEFKTVVDTKGTLGIGLFIIKLFGGSVDKQKTNDVDFQYVPKSRLTTGYEARIAQTFQQDLIDVIKSAALAVKQQQEMPANPDNKDPLTFKQLSITVSYGVTVAGSIGLSIPIHMVTLTAQLDRSKNNVQSVKLVFAPPPKPKVEPKTDGL